MSSKDRPSAENSVASPREGGEGETPGQPPDVADLANRIIEKARADLERRLADPVERAKWEALHASVARALAPPDLEPGEEVRWFSSDGESWRGLAGRAGWEVVKDGRVVRRIVKVLS